MDLPRAGVLLRALLPDGESMNHKPVVRWNGQGEIPVTCIECGESTYAHVHFIPGYRVYQRPEFPVHENGERKIPRMVLR